MAYVSSYAHLPPAISKSYLVQSSTPLQKQLAASGSYQVSPMLTAVPTNSTIPVESMANSPPPTFMTPIMTTSSAPELEQACHNSKLTLLTDPGKSRGNQKSVATALFQTSLWRENIPDSKKIPVQGTRCRSQQLPKTQIFNGRGSITWEVFIYQFERTAGLKKSTEAALQQDRRSDQIGTEAILRGYKDKDSARHVIERNPETINKATVTFTRIQSKSKRNPNNGVFKQQRVGPVGQRSTPKSIGHETSPHDKTEQRPTSPSDIVIRRTIGKSLVVRDTIYDQNVSMIVDTAAMITLVNEKLIPADNEDSETITLGGWGEQLLTGKIIKNTSLDIDRVNIQWDVCKAPLTDDVILGLDILDTLGAVINLSTPILTINNTVINAAFVYSGGEISIQQVCIKRTITVPPNSEMTVTINTNKSADQEFILEPCPMTSCVLVLHVVGKRK
ncbi:unnamed protein product [Mytilus coruscus]|uniref:Peptidase A2 domain-containing protein n=1 Tax=Mytilus coruscus TaxID=42192 RepID=A0A6J8BEA4_MYTCO|nr:unnamed protein product [Mytilus coruscus]